MVLIISITNITMMRGIFHDSNEKAATSIIIVNPIGRDTLTERYANDTSTIS